MKRKDLRLETEKENEEIYDHIQALFLQGKPIKVHESDFPSVTVDCYNIHITTDWSSVEAWWLKKIQQ